MPSLRESHGDILYNGKTLKYIIKICQYLEKKLLIEKRLRYNQTASFIRKFYTNGMKRIPIYNTMIISNWNLQAKVDLIDPRLIRNKRTNKQ